MLNKNQYFKVYFGQLKPFTNRGLSAPKHVFGVAVQGPAVRHSQPLWVPWPCLTCGTNSELLGMPLQQGAAMGLRQVRMTYDLTFQESCEPLGMGALPFQTSLSWSAKKGARSGWLG